MAVTFHTSAPVRADADDLLALMLDPDEQERLQRILGATEVDVTVDDSAAGRTRITLTTAEPAMKGAGTHRARLELDWNLAARRCNWVRHDLTMGDRVRASGTTEIVSAGEGRATIVEKGTIDVAVPVVGKQIAKQVVKKMEQIAPVRARHWEQRLRER